MFSYSIPFQSLSQMLLQLRYLSSRKENDSCKDNKPKLLTPTDPHICCIEFQRPFQEQNISMFRFEKCKERFPSAALILQNQPIWHTRHQIPKCLMISSQNTQCFCYGGIPARLSRIPEWTELTPLCSSGIASSSRIPPWESFAHPLLEPIPSRCSSVFHPENLSANE